MRNKMNVLIILISVALLMFCATKGVKIGKFEILSISGLIEKNDNLNLKIDEATVLTSTDFPENVQMLEETYETFEIQKQKYEDLEGVTNENNKEIYETKQYDIGYLWRVLGNYATKRNINLGIDVQKNNVGISSYNINFTLSGQYTSISQFITDIENDSDLYFRIYNFRMSGSGETINASFTVRNINIDASTIS